MADKVRLSDKGLETIELDDLISEYGAVQTECNEAEETKKRYAKFLMGKIFSGGHGIKYKNPDFSVSIQDKETKTISAEKLLAMGVPIEKIEAATTVSHSELFPVVRRRAKREAGKSEAADAAD